MATYTACCFAGPLDRQIVSNDSPYLRVAFPPKLSITALASADLCDPIPIREGSYRLERFAYRAPEFEHIWPAWVYDGGWIEDEKVITHIELAMRLLYELGRLGWMRGL